MPRPHNTVEPVNVQVKGKHFSVTADMRSHVVHKMQRLHKYLDRLSSIDVELGEESPRDAKHHNRVEATTRVAGRTIRVEAVDGDMYSAIDDAVDKLYRQLNRRKERMKSHSNTKLGELAGSTFAPELESPHGTSAGATQTAASDDAVVHIERLDMKPEFEDEAIADMRAAGHSFYVFLNAVNEQVNVLYRRDDGSLGLIQPHV